MILFRAVFAAAIWASFISIGSAQTTTPLVWKVQADDVNSSYILSSGDGARGIRYSRFNGSSVHSLLVASTANGNFVRRLHPSTGELKTPAVIPTHGYRTDSLFPINKVLTTDTEIYVTSLATTAAGQRFYIYRHEDEFSPETVAAEVVTDVTGANARMGDDVDIFGQGEHVKILVAGAGGSLQLFTTPDRGMTFTRTEITGIPAFSGTPNIAWNGLNRFYYRGSSGEPARRYIISGNTAILNTGPGDEIPAAAFAPDYGPFDFQEFSSNFSVLIGIGASPANTQGKPVRIFRISDMTHTFSGFGSEFSGGAKSNNTAAGQVILGDYGEYYVLYTNNSISRFNFPGSSVDEWNLF